MSHDENELMRALEEHFEKRLRELEVALREYLRGPAEAALGELRGIRRELDELALQARQVAAVRGLQVGTTISGWSGGGGGFGGGGASGGW